MRRKLQVTKEREQKPATSPAYRARQSVLIHPRAATCSRSGPCALCCSPPCLVCGRQPCDAHHLRFAQNRALGRKVSDEFTVPLCRGHHRELHRHGDEATWWRKLGLDPAPQRDAVASNASAGRTGRYA